MDMHQKLIRYITYPIFLRRWGAARQLVYEREFERSQFYTARQLEELQEHRLRALLDHAYRKCPFYRKRFDGAGLHTEDIHRLNDLAAFPCLEKLDIQTHGREMIAEDWPRKDLIADQTGGSTGRPISFSYGNERKCSRKAAAVRHNRWAGWDVGVKVAMVWGAPQDLPKATWRARLRNSLLDRQLFLDCGHLREDNLLHFHRSLKRFRPRILAGYAQALALLARFLRDRRLQAYQPHAIVASAEVLSNDDRTLLEDQFGCPVFNRYGCREVSVVASECDAHQGLHTMAEGLLVEIVNNAAAARAGEMGTILITDLLNFAMPLIRYRIGDLGCWEEGACRCGRELPRLRQVVGRITDFLTGADGRLVSGVFLATYVVAQRPTLGQVQIRQDLPGKLLYRICPGPHFDEAQDLSFLREASQRWLGEPTRVEFEFVEDLKPEPSGKFAFSVSSVTPNFLNPARPSPCPPGDSAVALQQHLR
jgi:phenylacetate-CoA ligase